MDPETKLITPNSWDSYYVKLYDHPVILVGFFDSKLSVETAEHTSKTLSYLRSTEYFERKEVPIMSVDMGLIPKIKSFYEFDENAHLWLFVKNRAYKYEEFGAIMKTGTGERNMETVYDWALKTVEGLIVETSTEKELSEQVAEKGVITVYLGDDNENFQTYRSWVLQYSKDPLYCMFDKEQREEFLKKWDKQLIHKLVKADDLIAVIWDKSRLNEFDSISFTMTKDFDDLKNLDIFYLFETQPKIRKESSTSDNVFLMYQRHLPLFLYNYQEGPSSQKNLNELNNALKVLPKRFVYDVFEHNSRRAIDYQHIMIQSSGYKLMEPNSLYILWLTHGTKPQIMRFDKDFNSDEIINWTFEFSKMFPRLFGNEKKETQQSTKLEEDL
jgi:hypothetical protein